MTRAPGFYWVRVKSSVPSCRKQVAEWCDGWWELIGHKDMMADIAIEVLSERLEEP